MQIDLHPPLTSTNSPSNDILDPIDIINAMIDFRFQLAELEQQIQALQPAFFAACIALNTDKITFCVVQKDFSPRRRDYSPAYLSNIRC